MGEEEWSVEMWGIGVCLEFDVVVEVDMVVAVGERVEEGEKEEVVVGVEMGGWWVYRVRCGCGG